MRLTLRTLLAYMDDILDPADQEDLARQVEQSEAATELIHRTRDAMRRLRLGAPPVMGEGMELDPNCVSEYLDNTMSPDDMSEFQQVCLDSDVHLAEVASCHHILTMVLGEPAQIDSDMRALMYAVPERLEEWRRQRTDGPHTAAAAVGASADASVPDDEHPHEVPDYLRASERSVLGRWALAFAAALVLGVTAFLAFGPDGWFRQEQVAKTEPADNGGMVAEPGEPEEQAAESQAGAPMASTDDGRDAPEPTAGTEAADAAEPAAPIPPEEPLTTAEPTPTEPTPSGAQADDEADSPERAPAGVPLGSAEIDDPAAALPAENAGREPEDVRVAVAPAPLLPAGGGRDQAEDRPHEADAVAAMEETELDVELSGVESGPQPPATDVPLGTVTGLHQVLLRWDESSREWLRLPPRASIAAGDRLLSLPTYRPSLALVLGLRVEFSDGAMMTLDYTEDGATPRLEVTYGRIMLQNTGMDNVVFELVVAGDSARVELASTAVLGLDIDRPFEPGRAVTETGGMVVGQFYAPEGGMVWRGGRGAIAIEEPAQWTWESIETHGLAPESFAGDADWLNGQSLDDFEQNVSRSIEKSFDTERPARQHLLEFYDTSRRREEKAVAAQCATHVWQFTPFVQALADTQQQPNWREHVRQLRLAMSRSPEAANLVREALVERRGAAVADDLFEMLRGYSPDQIGNNPDQIKTGITRQLIDWLDHDRLEYRVLAFHNLLEIYGGRTHNYNPVNTERARRERSMRTWRQRLADNELVPVHLQ